MRLSLVWLVVPTFALVTPAPHEGRRVVVTGNVHERGGGAALAGATVRAVGTGVGAVTDGTGSFTFATMVGERDSTLRLAAMRIGFAPETLTARVVGDTVTAHFTLAPVATQLSEVVVVGAAQGYRSKATSGAVAVYLRGTSTLAPSRGYGGGRSERRPRGDAYADSARQCPDIRTPCERPSTEEYDAIVENPFVSVRSEPRSTFSIDVDRASYSNVRRFVDGGALPPADAVRIEELVNYFPYAYAAPTDGHPIVVTADMMPAPWRPEHRLVRVAMQAKRMARRELPPSNLVFLIDVSGSMAEPNKLPLVQQSLRLLVEQLRAEDRVALVVYAGSAGLVLPSTPGSEKTKILDAIERLSAGGSTAGGAGIRLAYAVAKESFLPEGNNRVILATDGDFNVGASSDAELERLIEAKRGEGTYLTVLGFGMGNYKDAKMETLADKGNGNYAYIDDLMEARKTLVQEMGGTLVTVAKDVKLQIEFNPARVRAYRLIGYENRLLRDEDFTDDRKDAGEVGAGHSVTALYEVVPVGATTDVEVRERAPLRYGESAPAGTRATASDELLHVATRYKPPASGKSIELETVLHDGTTHADDDFTFAAAVASFGMLLRDSPHAGRATMEDVIAAAERSKGADEFGYRADFIRVARRAQTLLATRVVKR